MIFLFVLFLVWGVPLSTFSSRLRSLHLIDGQQKSNDTLNPCRSNYTDLVTISSAEDNEELVKILKSSSLSTGWIGASSCKWSNHVPVIFSKINSTFTGENCCGALNTDGEWEWFNCSSTKIYFMCYDQVNVTKQQTTNGSNSNGSSDYRQHSFNYSLIRENKTWFDAQRFCRKNHTDLVTIRNEEENERVKEAGNSTSFWIGLQYTHSFDWFDGGRSDYTHTTKSDGCFTLLSIQGFWLKSNGKGCSALCYKSFIHVSDIKMSWEEAWDYCDSHPNTTGLLRIESENDQNETERLLKERNISGPVWVGLRQSRLFGFWIWTNGLHLGSWTNWTVGSKSEHLISQQCGAMEKEDSHYKLSDKDCRSKFRVLCEK